MVGKGYHFTGVIKPPKGLGIKVELIITDGDLPAVNQIDCHGFTSDWLTGNIKDRDGTVTGKASLGGNSVPKIIKEFYEPTDPGKVQAGDVVIFKDGAGVLLHSGIIKNPTISGGKVDTGKTTMSSKDGFDGAMPLPGDKMPPTIDTIKDKYSKAQTIEYYHRK